MKKKWLAVCLILLLMVAMAASGCTGSGGLDPNKPVTLTLWHNFGGQMQTTMDELIEEFNRNVGKEKGIILNVTSVSGSAALQEKLTMIAAAILARRICPI